MNLYFAGPLFTQAERTWNLKLAALLAGAGHSVFLPQAEVQEIEHLDAETIFRIDLDGIRSADAVVAILDGADPDSGTSFECGVAFALGLPIMAVRTDFRAGGDALPGQKLATVNLMISQAATVIVTRTDSTSGLDDLASAIIGSLEKLTESPPPGSRITAEMRGDLRDCFRIPGSDHVSEPIDS